MSRLESLRQKPEISVLIVGAGINGIGTFRDLALQGIDVLLIDKGDFGAGASAASSHMVHGGLRYLENGEFRLVREALYERNLLLQNAPHYVKPLPTTIPIFNWFSGTLNAPLKFLRLRDKPGARGAIVIKLGLTLYDLFTRGQQILPTHKFASRRKSLILRPHLNPAILCTATYYDAWMPSPERICIELILDTESISPHAQAFNYLRLESAADDTVVLCDELTGEKVEVKPTVVINAAGPWIDFTNTSMQQKTEFIGGTKGSHLVVDHPELHAATLGNEMFFENKDGRITLFFPFFDKVLIGTTDIPIQNPDEAICTNEEVEYILEAVRIVFPKIAINHSHIVYRFSGVRPLPRSNTTITGQISRDHSIKIIEPNATIKFPIYSLIGGKWTTFRAFAEQTTDQVLARLHKPRQLSTAHMSIGGGKQYPRTVADQKQWVAALHNKTGLSEARLKLLFERYGTRAQEIAVFIASGIDSPLQNKADYSQREIQFLATHEKVSHLDDMLQRRTLLAMLGHTSQALIEELGGIMAKALAWSPEYTQREVERTLHLLASKHG